MALVIATLLSSDLSKSCDILGTRWINRRHRACLAGPIVYGPKCKQAPETGACCEARRSEAGAWVSVLGDDRRSDAGKVELPGKTSAEHAFGHPVALGEHREHDRLVAEPSKIGVP